ncbi:exodeoxyribonuclease VII large subunit [Clostridium sp. BJN0001]|uniref:exodeoxyribonuclease VII large subunit n=1 Tax=Clostridium sp. BJN0001 TaxID=2930219 RepID=UPI001FD5980D|nr:exodeoxyribonuclease VII large subunit [Clostridium sp. BJN0001]
MKIKTFSVSEVNNYIKGLMDNDFILRNLSVKGEISNLKYHSSGHIYFSLKDEMGRINCIMFRSSAYKLKFKLKEGMSCIVKCRASLYPAQGSIQLYVEEIEKSGTGDIYAEFEKLKNKLSSLGYFDESLKKPIPVFPRRIGVVTSETGAVINDIINVTKRRNNLVDIVLYPAKVQGIDAYKEIIHGIEFFNKKNDIDVLIVGRGGGSFEDLNNFNNESLAMAILHSKIPVISAVGHETDFTICDFVADKRASTPSQAAEIAVPYIDDIKLNIDNIKKRILDIITNKISNYKNELDSLNRMINIYSPAVKIANMYISLDELNEKLSNISLQKIKNEKTNLVHLSKLLSANNPIDILDKGYAIIENNDGYIKSIDSLKDETMMKVTLKDGKVSGTFMPIK